ncbi:general odorant-binding protein 83a-like [Drosophila albomicans]|uniref:General odorant-binding protein 83a-like n=1 Tax=Drosophila albomicans TaxID=7291 RepID=A0A9C6TB51_DROAB|nr:general odorant-binding protein 83a-like [Drosophila albomicans]
MVKFLVVTVLLSFSVTSFAAVTLSPEFLKAVRPIRDTCLKKSGSSDGLLKKSKFNKGPGAEDAKLKSYMGCVFLELNLVDANGDVMLEQLFQMLPAELKDVIMGMAKDCMVLQGATLNDKVWWLHQCWKKADPANYFML